MSERALLRYNQEVTILLLALILGDAVSDFNQAVAAEGKGDLAAAVTLLEKAQTETPQWGLAKIELAEVLLRQGGAVDHVLQLLAAAEQLDARNPRLFHLRGLATAEKQDPKAAEQAERAALKLRPDYADAQAVLAQAVWDQGRRDEAIGLWLALAQAHAENTALRVTLIDRLNDAGRAVDAEKQLRRLVAEQPSNPVWHRRLARTLDGEGLADEAADERAQAAALAGGTPLPKRKLRRLPDSRR